MKYCGTASPFKGSRVYIRCAMGMPGSESALEELLSRIVGDLIAKGHLAKIADNLYCGGQTDEELLANWEATLKAFAAANIRLTAPKQLFLQSEHCYWVGFGAMENFKLVHTKLPHYPNVKDLQQ